MNNTKQRTNIKYSIYPDYCSSGVWSEFANECVPAYLSDATKLLLKLWIEKWEVQYRDDDPEYTSPKIIEANQLWHKRWAEEGEILVNLLNHEADLWDTGDTYILDVEDQ